MGFLICNYMFRNGSFFTLLRSDSILVILWELVPTQIFSNPQIFVIKVCLCCRYVLLIECHLRSPLKGPLTLIRSCAEQIVVKKFGWFAMIIHSTKEKTRFFIHICIFRESENHFPHHFILITIKTIDKG